MGACHGSVTTSGAVIADRLWTHLCASIWHQRTLCSAPSKVKIKNNIRFYTQDDSRSAYSCFLFFSAYVAARPRFLILNTVQTWDDGIKSPVYACVSPQSVRAESAGRWRRCDRQQPSPRFLLPAAGTAPQEGSTALVTLKTFHNIMSSIFMCIFVWGHCGAPHR